MNRLGRVLHVSANKNLILRASTIPALGSTAHDQDLKEIGAVLDVFGPTNRPYISVKLSVTNGGEYVGSILYSLDDRAARREPRWKKKSRS